MKKIGKLFLCFALVITSLFFLGCSKVKLETKLHSNGKISTAFEVRLDDVPSQRATIYAIFKEYYSQLDKKYEDNLIYYFSFVYNTEAFNSADRTTKMEYILLNNTQYLVGDTDDCSIKDADNYKYFYVTKDFASIYAYLMYFCPSAFCFNEEVGKVTLSPDYHSLVDVPMPCASGEIEEGGNIFVRQLIQDFCPFYYNNEEPVFFYDKNISSLHITAGDKVVDVIKDCCGLTDDEAEYYFSFTTPYKRLHSSGEVEVTSSGYTHSWTLGSVDAKVEVWRNYANYVPWYIVAIIVGVLTIFISIIIIKTIHRKKKLKGLELLEKINDLEQSKN